MAFTGATETVVTYNLNGSQREFNIPFDYLSRSFVQVTVFGESTDKLLVVGDDYNYLDSRTISTVRALGGSDGWKRLQIRRYTSDDRIVDFKDGSVLKSADLNVAVVQSLHIAAEGRDGKFDLMGVNSEGNWDALDRKINRLAAGTERRDAVNLGQMQDWSASALNQANRAKQEADNAARSATAAKVSETNSKTSENNSKTSETNAKTHASDANHSMVEAAKSQNSAKVSETNAKTSENASKTSENASKADADRSYREAERAKGYADGMGHAIDIGYTIENMDGHFIRWKGNHEFNQSVGVRDKYPNPTTGIQFESPFGESRPRIATMINGTRWGHYTFNPDYPGTLATQEWINKAVSYNETETTLTNPSGDRKNELVVKNDGTVGAYNYTQGRWAFRTDGQGFQSFGSHAIVSDIEYVGYKAQRSDGTSVQWQTSPYRSNEQGREAFGFFEQDKPVGATNVNQWYFAREGNVTLASREWVGKRISEEFFWKKSTVNHDNFWRFHEEISSIPPDHIFSRTVRHHKHDVDYYLRRVY